MAKPVGILISILGVLALSLDPLFYRLSSLSANSLLTFKYSIATVTYILFVALTTMSISALDKKFKELGWLGLIAGIILGVENIFFALAILNGNVGLTMIITATGPLITALINAVVYQECVSYRIAITCLICFGSILAVFLNDVRPNGSFNEIKGSLFAVFATISMGIYFSIIHFCSRTNSLKPDMIPCNIIGCMTVVAFSLVSAGGVENDEINPIDWAYLILQGVVAQAAGFGLLTLGLKFVPATEVALLMLIQTVMSPIFVFLAGYEQPTNATIYAGCVLVFTLAVNSLLAIYEVTTPSVSSPLQNPDADAEGLDVVIDVQPEQE